MHRSVEKAQQKSTSENLVLTMQMIKIGVAVAALLSLAACSIEGPKVRLHPPVKVKVEGGGHGGGYHCPPGQAKKGNC